MMLLGFIVACIVLYWVGGQKWAHTLFRDFGCPLCMLAVALLLLEFHWSLFGLFTAWVGFAIGDHDKQFWTFHGLGVSLGMALYAVVNQAWIPLIVSAAVVTLGTYLVSRYLSKGGWDVWIRGSLYATVPFWYYLWNTFFSSN